MQSATRKKILIVLTNMLSYGDTAAPTGLWLGEATEFAEIMVQAGYHVDYVSPRGGFVPLDPRSMKYTDAEIMQTYATADFQHRALAASLAPVDVKPADYQAIYYAGGHGVMWDFPDNQPLQQIAAQIYTQGGYVTAVCHGIAGLLNIKTADGRYLIANRQVTGFTKSEELLAGKQRVVPFFNRVEAEKRGAHFQQKRAYREFAVQDDRLITGQNPFSAKAVARLLVRSLAN